MRLAVTGVMRAVNAEVRFMFMIDILVLTGYRFERGVDS
jgi:hypothetical protein